MVKKQATDKPEHVSSCTILWENTQDILSVKTRILPKEIEVRHYNGDELIGGQIWPLHDHEKQKLFDIFYKPKSLVRKTVISYNLVPFERHRYNQL